MLRVKTAVRCLRVSVRLRACVCLSNVCVSVKRVCVCVCTCVRVRANDYDLCVCAWKETDIDKVCFNCIGEILSSSSSGTAVAMSC